MQTWGGNDAGLIWNGKKQGRKWREYEWLRVTDATRPRSGHWPHIENRSRAPIFRGGSACRFTSDLEEISQNQRTSRKIRSKIWTHSAFHNKSLAVVCCRKTQVTKLYCSWNIMTNWSKGNYNKNLTLGIGSVMLFKCWWKSVGGLTINTYVGGNTAWVFLFTLFIFGAERLVSCDFMIYQLMLQQTLRLSIFSPAVGRTRPLLTLSTPLVSLSQFHFPTAPPSLSLSAAVCLTLWSFCLVISFFYGSLCVFSLSASDYRRVGKKKKASLQIRAGRSTRSLEYRAERERRGTQIHTEFHSAHDSD